MTRFAALRQLFFSFFKVGCFTFGGGLAMLPLIQNEAVNKRRWVEEKDIVDIFAISQSLPGVISVNSSIFIGYRVAGFPGAAAAAFGVIFPAFASILLIVTALSFLRGNPVVDRIMGGIKAASAALILIAAVKVGKSAVRGKAGAAVAVLSFIAIIVFKVHAAWTIVFGAAAGYLLYRFSRREKNHGC
ncbi:MAG: chromate transporter [Spirochaetota bacterium]